jgi:tetratricopeptide (TPR) repeat protein
MNKLKIGLMAFALLVLNTAFAQTIEVGKQQVYYERYTSARETFQKLVAANPNDDVAIYWLGQAMILPDDVTSKDISAAKSLYQSKLSIPNNFLIMVGIGQIELMEGKIQDARSRFETAVSLTAGKNLAVLNAIGFANGNPDSKNGDAAYAIEKLKQATQLKKFNDPEVLVNLGDAYRKNNDGGNADQSYKAALTINPNYARANFRLGKLYQSQGRGQESIFMEFYDKAIASDPAFAPVYSTLFNYFYETNVTKAAEYFEKWQANSDVDYKTCYYRAALKYAQGYFMEAITKSDECINESKENPYPNLFGLKANAFNRLKDSVHAVESYAEYFKRQSPEKITSGDYVEYAKNLLKIPGNEAQAGLIIDKAVSMDSIESNKVQYLKTVAQAYENRKRFVDAADWYNKIIAIKKNPSKYDLNTTAFNYYKGGDYQKSIAAFTLSANKFTDDPYAYNMIGKASWAIDTTMEQGLANMAFEKTIQLSMVDTIKYKPQLMTAYKYFVAYYANIKKDKDMALSYVEKALALDPNDAEAKMYKEAIIAKPASTSKPKEGKKP